VTSSWKCQKAGPLDSSSFVLRDAEGVISTPANVRRAVKSPGSFLNLPGDRPMMLAPMQPIPMTRADGAAEARS